MADLGHIDPVFEARLMALIKASGGKVQIGNSYRSTARQQQLFDAAVKKYGSETAARKWVAKPGHSKHQEGVAADLKGDLAWAHQNAAAFGLVFPLSHESWHVEMAGARSGKDAHASTTAPAGGGEAPGNPDALNDLVAPDLHDPKVQTANFLAILAQPNAPTTAAF